MPRRAPRICNQSGCGEFGVHDGYCNEHYLAKRRQKRTNEKPRASARERGYTKDWERARVSFLIENPFCVECQRVHNRLVQATVVDHKAPHKGDRQLFWDRSNWQPLCTPHHNSKTVREDGGFGHAVKRVRAQ